MPQIKINENQLSRLPHESETGSESREQADNGSDKAIEPYPKQNINLQNTGKVSFMKLCSPAKLVDRGKISCTKLARTHATGCCFGSLRAFLRY